jgi:predicted PurR-regulated permease PerM
MPVTADDPDRQAPAPQVAAEPAPAAAQANAQPTQAPSGPDLIRPVLGILALLGLIAVSIWVLRPFIPPLIWAATIVIASWSLMRRVQGWLWNSRSLATIVMTLALLLLFFVPLGLAIGTVVENADTVVGWLRTLAELPRGAPPDWLGAIPLAGSKLVALWTELGQSNLNSVLAKITPYAGAFAGQALKQAGVIGSLGAEFLFTVVLCAVFYQYGEGAANRALGLARRLAGERGERTARLAADSVRGVALGVVVTALVQSLLAALGLALVGIPAITLLTAVMVLLSIAQIGALPVLIPATLWVFSTGQTGWAIALGLWTVFVATIDNVLRPWLIRQGADLPLLLIFAGVIGGLMAFGLIGLFIGPVVLAVTHTLLDAWIDEAPAEAESEQTRRPG